MRFRWRLQVAAAAAALCCATTSLGQEVDRAARIRADAASILRSREYRWEVPHESPLAALGRWIAGGIAALIRWLSRLVPSRRGGIHIGGIDLTPFRPVIFVLYALVISMVVYMIYQVVRHVRVARAPKPERARRKRKTVELVAPVASEATEDLVEKARLAFERGEVRQACRSLYLALLYRLDGAGVLRYDRARTNGEYLRQTRGNARVHGLLAPEASRFDLVWYGGRQATEDDYRRGLSALEQAAHLVDETANGAPARAR